MRKISAHYILPADRPPIKNGIIHLDEDGRILDLVDPAGPLKETSRLEFYSGIITPGFVLPYVTGLPSPLLFDLGIRGIGVSLEGKQVVQDRKILERCKHYKISLQIFFSLDSESDAEDFEIFNEGIDLCSNAWNEYGLSCSVMLDTPSIMESDLPEYLLEYARTHPMVLPLLDTGRYKLESQFQRLLKARARMLEDKPCLPLDLMLLMDDSPARFRNVGTLRGSDFNLYPVLSRALPDDKPAEPVSPGADFPSSSQGKSVGPGSMGLYLLNPSLDKYGNTDATPSKRQGNPILQMFSTSGAGPLYDLLPAITRYPADLLGMDELGSISPGKKPGLNLISGLDPESMRLGVQSELKILV